MSEATADDRVSLDVEGLAVAYAGRPVVQDFGIVVGRGEVVALTGPSGSGKSSILSCVVGVQVPDRGRVTVAGVEVTGLRVAKRAELRRTLIGIAYQSPGLLPELTIEENVAITLLFDGMSRSEALDAARASLHAVGLEGHGGKRVDEISGGEAQRVSLARALVRDSAALLVADEPTASLDAQNAVAVAELMVDRVRQRRIGALLATHDERVAGLCDRVVDLRSMVAA